MIKCEGSSERLSEVSRLASLLADRVLDAQMLGRPIPNEQIRALARAALLLEEYAVLLPTMLIQVLHEIEAIGAAQVTTQTDLHNEKGPDTTERLAWLLRPFQGSQ